jgi:2-desacetyl-2-hydroxyethyl bacteriochlorophyllide A dehydrogenase
MGGLEMDRQTEKMVTEQTHARSVWFSAPGAVELRREPLAKLRPDEVRVRAIASAISHGTEMLVYRGQVDPELDLDLPTLRGGFSFPIKYGYASVGRVVEVGALVQRWSVGDLVFVHHPHQSEYIVSQHMPISLPSNPGASVEDAVFLANLETALNVTLDAHPRFGERVLILGQGVIGLLLTQLMKMAGVGLVIAVDPLPMRREMAMVCGADVALSPDEGLLPVLQKLTSDTGVDLAIEASGSGEALRQAIEGVAFQGTVVVCSWYGTKLIPLPLGGAFHRGRVRIISSQVSHIDPALHPRWDTRRRMSVARDLLPKLKLAPLITHRFPVQQAARAYELVDTRPEQAMQVILTYGEDDV